MSRDISASVIALLDNNTIYPVNLFELEFDSSTLHLWDGDGDLSWDGETWLSNGWVYGYSTIGETDSIQANGVTITITGIPSELLSMVLSESKHKHTGIIYQSFLDASGDMIADSSCPSQLFKGYLDYVEIVDNPQGQSRLVLSYEHELIKLGKGVERAYTAEDQKSEYSADKGFDYVASLAKWRGYWGLPDEVK